MARLGVLVLGDSLQQFTGTADIVDVVLDTCIFHCHDWLQLVFVSSESSR